MFLSIQFIAISHPLSHDLQSQSRQAKQNCNSFIDNHSESAFLFSEGTSIRTVVMYH